MYAAEDISRHHQIYMYMGAYFLQYRLTKDMNRLEEQMAKVLTGRLWVNKYVIRLAQWLSGRVLDLRLKGGGFEPHWCHCVVVLEQDTFIPA